MKIKTKKQLNLPQLIEWGFENYVTGSIYSDDRVEAKKIRFEVGAIASMYGDMHKGDTFTVEVEEEITEDTVIPEMLTIFSDGTSDLTNNKSLNYLIKETSLKSAYIMNDDLRLILIWTREKGMVE